MPTIEYERLAAPSENLGILVEPGAEQIHAALHGAAIGGLERAIVLNRPLKAWRAALRRRLDLAGPVVVAGHQAEFFHAGVFAKTIAAHTLAARTGGTAVFLTVDSDLPKTPMLTVPQITHDGLRSVDVVIPNVDPQSPLECQLAGPRQHWLDFFVRVASIHEHYDASLLRPFADAWLADDEPEISYCDAADRGWSALEESVGLPGVRRLRISELCATPEFRAFAAHLLLNAGRLAQDYNAAQAGYRRRHRVRSANRPVPPLAAVGERTEVPLWVSGRDGPRRRVYVAQRGERVELYGGHDRVAEMPSALLADPERVGQAWPLERTGWRLRPRALALSAFARLFLADLFVHGIGGAKYDEITDEYLRGFLQVEPPPICCVSATVYLPLPRTGVRWADVLAARHVSRDLRYNPQRYVHEPSADLVRQRAEMIRQSDQFRARVSRDRAARRFVFEEIHRLSDELLSHDQWRAAEFDQRVQTLEQQWQRDRIALDREYFTALHLKTTIQELVSRLREPLTAPK